MGKITVEIKLPLTKHQKSTLDHILDIINEKSYPPTISEIQNELGFRNPGYVHKILCYLAKKGYIVKLKKTPRGIRLTRLSEKLLRKRRRT